MQTQPLDHAKLKVYQLALDLLEVFDRIIEALPAGRAHLKDQLDRAGTSTVLNIAEGAGEFAPAEKRRFYRMARRSTIEGAAVLDVLDRRKQVSEQDRISADALIISVVAILTKMATR